MHNLQFLDINGCTVSASLLNQLQSIPSLRGVNILDCKVIDDVPVDTSFFSRPNNSFKRNKFLPQPVEQSTHDSGLGSWQRARHLV
jgi:hypothetical protein